MCNDYPYAARHFKLGCAEHFKTARSFWEFAKGEFISMRRTPLLRLSYRALKLLGIAAVGFSVG
ncbi:MAG: hypothetical protein J6C39_00730, partial [Clostridia bacterium]|nr:hypothetical protein [Clostridia bacterium]